MPPRLVNVAIILFWLAMTGMLVYQEFAPRFQAGAAPPFTIDLTTEVSANIVNWNVLQKGERVGSGFTQVKRNQDRTYDFTAQFKLDKFKLLAAELSNLKVVGAYRVSEEGKLLAGSANLKGVILIPLELDFQGEVKDRLFHPKLTVVHDGQELNPFPIEPFPVSDSGSILNPMHLVHKISGLRDGQSWSIPLMDPLRAAPAWARDGVLGKELIVSHVLASVTTEDHEWLDQMVPCFKISYAKPGERPLAATWVRRRDAVVLEQWASYEGIEYTLQRAPGD
jgi:hypothetical protein